MVYGGQGEKRERCSKSMGYSSPLIFHEGTPVGHIYIIRFINTAITLFSLEQLMLKRFICCETFSVVPIRIIF